MRRTTDSFAPGPVTRHPVGDEFGGFRTCGDAARGSITASAAGSVLGRPPFVC
ncbi:hypothetical protein C791_2790 [Amycolatopsis azurea DSM 43854]|uniref:Uncharacterized protein n=1 Tax=Amycolatopsis azurea DSM 43854 TaxID=1238180 RepID=M2Q4T7_9PSEU|nr:hypothetical protein C791_2790 [Amycolatopsis azurea DSM 43854]